MTKIVGSGSRDDINLVKGEEYIFVNTSHTRIKPKQEKIKFLFLSHGLLLTENEIKSLKPIPGKSKSEATSLRLKRVKCQNNLSVDNLYCITPLARNEVVKRIATLNIKYQKLTLIRDWRIYLMLIVFLKTESIFMFFDKKVSLPDKLKVFATFFPFLRIKPSTALRPSSGMIAFLWAYSKPKIFKFENLVLNGVTGDLMWGANLNYELKRKELREVHCIDKRILKRLIRMKSHNTQS